MAVPTTTTVPPAEVLADCTTAALDALMAAAGGPAWDEAAFAALRDAVRGDLVPEVEAAAPDELVLADGFSCRTQITELTGRRSLHLAQVLDRARPTR